MEKKLYRKQLLLSLLCVALTLIVFGLANAETYYVSNAGSDGNAGTGGWGNAFEHIQYAVDVAEPTGAADTINVAPGNYPENVVIDNSANKAQIDLIGWGGYSDCVIDATGKNTSVIEILTGSGNISITNFKITGGLATNGAGIHVAVDTDSATIIPNILFENLEITKNRATSYGGGVYAYYSKVTMVDCCIHKNDAHLDGGGLYLSWPGGKEYTLSYTLRDCCVFHNHAEVYGGGIYMNQDNNYSMIFNCLIRQNLNGAVNGGGGIHYNCAEGYVKNCTIADNYYDGDVGFTSSDHGDDWGWSTVPLWGQNPTVGNSWGDVYGVYSSECYGCEVRLIHNIIYYNGPPDLDDVEDDIDGANTNHEIEAWYCDIQMGAGGTYAAGSSSQNMDADPLFVKSDDFGSYECNSTLYFLDNKSTPPSPCINAGYQDAAWGGSDDPNSWGSNAGDHSELVNTLCKTKPQGYSVHIDASQDLDYYSDNKGCGGSTNAVDLGYHYDYRGMNYIGLASFSANVHSDKVVLKWETATEIDNAGFLVYRCANEASECIKISDFIAASGDAVGGATYSFTDTNVAPGAGYYYYLVDIDASGEWTAHGPVFARIPKIVEPIVRLQTLGASIR